MAINVQYGPISSALSLAQKAGNGQRFRQQQQLDQAFIAQVNEQKARDESAYANTIHNALAGDMARQNQQSEDAQRATQNAFNQQQLAQQAALGQQRIAVSEQNANTGQQRAFDVNQHYDTADQIAQQRADRPSTQQNNEYRLASAEYRRLIAAQQAAQKNMNAAMYDEQDMKKLGTRQSMKTPGAIEGHEQQFLTAQKQLADLGTRIQSADQYLQQHQQDTIAPNAAPVNQQVLRNYAGQQSAPDTQSRIVKTATNPDTGEKIGFDANTGQWVKLGS